MKNVSQVLFFSCGLLQSSVPKNDIIIDTLIIGRSLSKTCYMEVNIMIFENFRMTLFWYLSHASAKISKSVIPK